MKSELRPDPEWLVLPSTPSVPLELMEPPTVEEGALFVTLTESAGRQLFEFTQRSVGRPVAVVIGGEIVTVHVIRTALTGGQLQISC
ncbi:MAG: hypothetical protein AAF488_08460 [Planctomycetota bacterium]